MKNWELLLEEGLDIIFGVFVVVYDVLVVVKMLMKVVKMLGDITAEA